LAVLLIVGTDGITWLYSLREQPMLFQHGTPEVAGGRAIAIMNPFEIDRPKTPPID
jgi:hypothetical protein